MSVRSDVSALGRRGTSRRPTIKDIAALTGLSKATVSRAINGRDRISPATRERVLATLDAIGYTPSHAATSLSTGRTRLLGLMIGANRNPTALSAMQGALMAATAAQYGVIVYITEKETEHDVVYTQLLAGNSVDGAIHLFPRKEDESVVRKMHERGLPVIVIEPQAPMAGIPTVQSDAFDDGYISTRHLVHLGHRRIALCADVPGWGVQDRYIDGYFAALDEAGIPRDPNLTVAAGWTHDAGYLAASQWLDLPDAPTGMCFCCDTAALGALSAARDRNIRLPEDLSIVGYDDSDVGQWVNPSLTTLRGRRSGLVQRACELLVALIDGQARPVQEVVVRTDLVVRGSTGPAPNYH